MRLLKQYYFLIASAIVLIATTVYWSLLSAVVHQQNADQLADPGLFEDWATFTGSVFPTQHTFLLKWPLFFLVQLLGGSTFIYAAATVALSLLTVGLFCLILSKIERRPHCLALLFLALASVLLLVPIEPKPGSLLPVGMGMLATRNIEYIVLFGAALLVFRDTNKRLLNKQTIVAGVLLGILFASDQLFTGLTIGGSVLLLLLALIAKRTPLRVKAVRMLVVAVAGAAIAIVLVLLLRLVGLLDTSPAAPYDLELSPKNGILAVLYGVLGILSQFGANSVSSTVIAGDIPRALVRSIDDIRIIGTVINSVITLGIGYAVLTLLRRGLSKPIKKVGRPKKSELVFRDVTTFGLFVMMTAITSVGLFVVTNHYYAVDARYIGIVFFAGFIALAIWLSQVNLSEKVMRIATATCVIGCLFGLFGAAQGFQLSQRAYADTAEQNALIAKALEQHPVDTLVADYWRAYPIVNQSTLKMHPLPLASCFERRKVLASDHWNEKVYERSFAYLLTTQPTGTGFPVCSLSDVRQTFGTPSDTLVVSGTAANPSSMLLFYDNGKHLYKPEYTNKNDDNSLLKNLSELKNTKCASGKTVLQTIAHQDDDILFMNPALIQGVKSGDCIVTVYFTAGDAGSEQVYWLAREEGAKAAYAKLFSVNDLKWYSRDVRLSDNHQVKVARLKAGAKQATLVFMRLPDGNVDGSGYAKDRNESLQKIIDGTTASIGSVDHTSTYSKTDIVNALKQIMQYYQPEHVRTQTTINHSQRFSDHSDHLSVGQLTRDAYDQYAQSNNQVTIEYFIGYPVRERPPNVTGEDLLMKKDMFFTYASHDPSTCVSDIACERTSYHVYLDRQYSE